MDSRVILIGLDGATFSVLDALMQDGVMPFLKGFIDGGTRAGLMSVIPPLTPPAWTSLMTGRSPGQHGIFDFFRKASPESRHIRYLVATDVTAETVWSVAGRQARRVTVLNFPLMFPSPNVNGYSVAGWMPWKQLALGCYPPDLYQRLKALPGFNPRELAMDMELEEKALEGCRREEYEDWLSMHIRREEQWFHVFQMLMEQDPCHLTALLFDGMDKVQHLCWRFIDPRYAALDSSPWAARVRERVMDYFRGLDQILRDIAAMAAPDTTFVIASDHGFQAQTGTLFINTWLEQHGYLAWADEGVSRTADAADLGISQVARHMRVFDWERTRAYAATSSGCGIHIVTAGPNSPQGVPQAQYEAFRDKLAQELRNTTDPDTGQEVVSQVWTREAVFQGPHLDLAPDLTLALHDGGVPSIVASEDAYKTRSEPVGTHSPEGVFVAHGPGVRQGVQLPPLSILDISPLLLYCLDLAIPNDMEGRVPTEVFEPGFVAAKPVRVADASSAARPDEPESPSEESLLDPESEQAILNRLRGLGYIE